MVDTGHLSISVLAHHVAADLTGSLGSVGVGGTVDRSPNALKAGPSRHITDCRIIDSDGYSIRMNRRLELTLGPLIDRRNRFYVFPKLMPYRKVEFRQYVWLSTVTVVVFRQ